MGDPAKGFESNARFAEESTFGTPAVRTNIIEIVSESVKLNSEPIQKQSMRSFQPRGFFLPVKRATGDLVAELFFQGHEKLLKTVFGSVVTNVIEAGTVFEHIFSPVKVLPSITLELEKEKGNFVYPGTKINSLNVSLATDLVLLATYGIVGNDELPLPQTPTGSLVFPAERLPVFHQGNLKIDASTVQVDSFEATMNNNLAERPKLGSRLENEPVRNDLMVVEGTFVGDFEDDVQYNNFINGVAVALQLEIIGPIIPATSSNLKLVIDVPRAIYLGETPSVAGPGIVKQNFPFRGLASEDLVTPSFRITLQNELSAV